MRAVEFTSEDAQNLRTFLGTATGQKIVPKLLEYRPHLLDGSDNGKTLVRSGIVVGFELAVNLIEELTETELNKNDQPTSENYPSLDDDSKWENNNPQ